MGLTTSLERTALLELATEATKRTSFSRQLSGPTLQDHVRVSTSKIQDLAGAVAPPPGTDAAKAKTLADVKIVSKLPKGQGFKPNGQYYSVSIDFALGLQGSNTPSPAFATADEQTERDEWGQFFGNPLVNPRKSTVYMVRATVNLLRVEPLPGGLILRWVRPVGWTWVDGQGVQIPVQVASNPVVMTRLVQTPATTVANAGFTVSVVAWYP
jgi:hypothetical protein